jgi:hypothetical protein
MQRHGFIGLSEQTARSDKFALLAELGDMLAPLQVSRRCFDTPKTTQEKQLETAPPRATQAHRGHEKSRSLYCGGDGGLRGVSQREFTLDDFLKSNVREPRPDGSVHKRTASLVQLAHPLADNIHKHLLVRHMFKSFFQ